MMMMMTMVMIMMAMMMMMMVNMIKIVGNGKNDFNFYSMMMSYFANVSKFHYKDSCQSHVAKLYQ